MYVVLSIYLLHKSSLNILQTLPNLGMVPYSQVVTWHPNKIDKSNRRFLFKSVDPLLLDDLS